MKFDSALMARLQAATQELMKDGPMAATAAIQRALAGDTAPETDATDNGIHTAPRADASFTAPGAGATMKDLNAPPEKAPARPAFRARKAAPKPTQPPHAAPGEKPETKQGETPHAGTAMSGLADILAKSGITLPEGLADSFKEKFKGGFQGGLPEGLLDGLPEALKNGKLPGARKRTPPPPLPDGARFDSASFTCSAGTRGYKLYVPSTYKADQPVPLVVMLHGCTQDPDDFAAGTRMNQVAEETGCLVAYPGQTQQANSSKCWNWFSVADQQRDRGEPAIIAGIARQVIADFAVDPARVSIAGLSAGGAMAIVVGALYPELFNAVGVHSGLPIGSASDLPSALQAMQQGAKGHARPVASPPVIVFHGDKDHTVNQKNGNDVLQHGLVAHEAGMPEVASAKASGGRKYTRTLHKAKDGRVLAEHWQLHGAGHAWAGGAPVAAIPIRPGRMRAGRWCGSSVR
ncbi:extracellular catalytic domain type 1 short-chain-length polyhydroxyalkanoate depolymerase [Pseudoduganella lutea]|uniref:extracellular catalytic domain type 1 short-chain-length polyhydroxyalkanoate depolymerase n=1 Tax=Pseudoduganella lutea TaxID=321985 RepID=UPI001E3848EC|nr:PHB depolymerase family esterase [Pseudoduganella lutea]